MTLTLHVDGARWRANQAAVLSDTPGLVPVIKGNGYGFGRARLAGQATAPTPSSAAWAARRARPKP